MTDIEKLVRSRRSVRTYDERPISPEVMDRLYNYIQTIENPFGLPVEFKILDANAQALKCPVVVGTDTYIGGKMDIAPHFNEAFGYSMEMLILYAQSIGLGTVWIGGTMDRTAFENAMDLKPGQIMPCVTPIGYIAKKMSLRETLMRKGVKANDRLNFDQLFFDKSFNDPLTQEKAGKLRNALEMVRLAPSAVNKQPWRIVLDEDAAHFYVLHSKGFGGQVMDMQKIDIGIAMCHFKLIAEESGLEPEMIIADPGITVKNGEEYIATYKFRT